MEHKMVCIVCPIGCNLTVVKNGEDIKVTGNQCPRGDVYGRKELVLPTRVLPTTVKIEGALLPRLPVKTDGEIPKSKIFDAMKEINKVVVKSPIKAGDILIENIFNTGVNVVSSRDL